MPDVYIDSSDWDAQAEEMAAALGGLRNRGVQRALERTVRKTGKWVGHQVAKQAAQSAGLALRRFKQMRVNVRINREDAQIAVWIGANPWPVNRQGRVEWTRKMRGARAGRKTYRGTFAYRGTNPKNPIVLMRQEAAQPSGTVQVHKGAELAKVAKPIAPEVEEAVRRIERRAAQRFRTVLRQELNYEMAKRFPDK